MERVLPLMPEVRDPMAASGFLHAYTSTLAMSSEYARSLASLETAIDLANRHHLLFTLGHFHVTEALCHIGTGRSDLATSALSKAASAPLDNASREFVVQNCTATLARLHLSERETSTVLSVTDCEWPSSSDPQMISELVALRALALRLSGRRRESGRLIEFAKSVACPVEVIAISLVFEMLDELDNDKRSEEILVKKFRQISNIRMEDTLLMGLRSSENLAIALRHLTEQRAIDRSNRALIALDNLNSSTPSSAEKRQAGASFGLTAKETVICELLQSGLSNKAIAQELFLAESTVKLHLRNIFRKLDVSNRTQGVLKLIQEANLGDVRPAR
jgi:ATP/maltotriose-dependent transcriptional regulator MalT